MNTGEEHPVQIGEAAEALGVTTRYLRKLEAQGATPRVGRDARGFRIYAEADLELLRSIGVGTRPRKLRSPKHVPMVAE
jgi:DNA-binding transcriptional MerR regulator